MWLIIDNVGEYREHRQWTWQVKFWQSAFTLYEVHYRVAHAFLMFSFYTTGHFSISIGYSWRRFAFRKRCHPVFLSAHKKMRTNLIISPLLCFPSLLERWLVSVDFPFFPLKTLIGKLSYCPLKYFSCLALGLTVVPFSFV